MLRKLSVLLLSCSAVFTSCAAWSQAYPARAVRLIVPFGPGAPDSVARIVGQQLSTQMGQPFVIDNRPGANGIIGSEAVAKAPADGYTLMATSLSFSVNPSMYRKLPYDSMRDFSPVSNIADQEANILVVNPSFPARSVQELVAHAKQPNSRISYASIGVGNTTHLAGELFNLRAGTKIQHIPYKGGAAAVAAVMSGEVEMMIVPAPQSLQYIKAGKLRALGYTYRTRASFLPDVPTMAEAGITGMEFDGGWFGMFAPANTPAPVVGKLHAEIRAALTNALVKERLNALGLRPVGSNSPEEFKRFVETEIKHFAEIVRMTGIQPE